MIDSILGKLEKLANLSNTEREKLDAIKIGLSKMGEYFSDFLSTMNKESDPLITYISSYYVKYSGKQLRPFLLMYLVTSLDVKITDEIVKLAMAYELLHISTLYHDDVMDEALYRRYVPAVNNLYGNKLAILAGDLLLSYFGSVMINIDNKLIQSSINDAFKKTVIGQIYEVNCSNNFVNINEKNYFKIIKNKTAAIFSSIFVCAGRYDSSCEREKSELLEAIGLDFGIAFQIMDDLLDISSSTEKLGKNAQNDIEQSTITLPIVYLMESDEVGKDEIQRVKDGTGNVEEFYGKVLNSKAFKKSYGKFALHFHRAVERSVALENRKFTDFLSTLLGYMDEKLHESIESAGQRYSVGS